MSVLADKISAPRIAPNLFLTGYQDDDVLPREQLATEWQVTTRTVGNLQNEENGLPFFVSGNKVFFRAGSAREWMRRREHRLNQRHQRRNR